MSMRVGLDLVCSDTVRESVRVHGEHYLNRIYTGQELEDCRGDPLRLAARFAAKEATFKVLGRTDQAISWQSVAVRRDEAGRPSIELSGAAADLAQERGIRSLEVSLTHEEPFAAAVVLAELVG
jgi:holo-[acyl-carrier protein] synthase